MKIASIINGLGLVLNPSTRLYTRSETVVSLTIDWFTAGESKVAMTGITGIELSLNRDSIAFTDANDVKVVISTVNATSFKITEVAIT